MVKTIEEKHKEHLNNFKTAITDMVYEQFMEDGGINPGVFGLIIKDDVIAICILHGLGEIYNDSKELFANAIKQAGKDLKFIALALASEAYASKSNGLPQTIVDADGELRENVIKTDGEKKDVLIINFETFNQSAIIGWEVKDEIIKKTLTEFINQDWISKTEAQAAGVFANLIEDNYSELAMMLKNQIKNNLS